MKLFYIIPLLVLATLLTMTIKTHGQPHVKKYLILQLPNAYKWTENSFDNGDSWGVHYKGFLDDERFPSITFSQVNTLNQHVKLTIPKLAVETLKIFKAYDDAATMQLRKKSKIDGDDCFLYSITIEDSVLLFFYRQSNEAMYNVEMELHTDQLEKNSLATWEILFFSSITNLLQPN